MSLRLFGVIDHVIDVLSFISWALLSGGIESSSVSLKSLYWKNEAARQLANMSDR